MRSVLAAGGAGTSVEVDQAAQPHASSACFQGMWVALGDPPLGEWRHLGITRRFCSGQWVDPAIDPRNLAALYKGLLALYELRLDAHYRALAINSQQAKGGVDMAAEVMQLMQQHKRRQSEGGS